MAWNQTKDKPDKALVKDQIAALQAMMTVWGAEHCMSALFWILTKQEQTFPGAPPSTLVPFTYNRIQRYLEQEVGPRNLLLKARQIGGTTWFLLRRLLLPAITTPGTGSMLISQNNDYVEKHFYMARRAYRYIGAVDPWGSEEDNQLCISLKRNALHCEASNRRELIFDQLDSRVMVASAEVEESAQGVTLHHILADEYSRWPGDPEATLSNVMGALVKTGTLDKNCTANGTGGAFYTDCMRTLSDAKNSDAKLFFCPWWWDDGYQIDLTEKEKDEMETDLEADELRIIAMIHKDLKEVAHV